MGSDSLAKSGRGKLAWGILGTGGIARTFARDLSQSKTGQLLAVGSRTAEAAARFADEFAIPRRYDSYEAMLRDPEVEAVYISLPNHLHAQWVVKCAQAGKQILCEKPLATNVGEAMVAIEAARAHNVFLMEAFMYRCHPQTAKLVELIREKAIGEVRVIQAHFSYNLGGLHLENIRQQNQSAGGSIMDVGCYCASMARLIAGAATGQDFAEPLEIKAVAHIGEKSRVDEWSTAASRFPGGIVANLTCGTQVNVDNTLRIWGSEGHILVPQPWKPQREGNRILVYREAKQQTEEIVVGADVPLYAVEADTVAAQIANRQALPPAMTWADSLGNMRMLDYWRKEIGLVFDNER